MKLLDLSRRRFVQIAGTVAAARIPSEGADPPTAEAIVERVQTALGGEAQANGRDGFKAGDPKTPVRGIATTAMATMEVLKQASAAGANLIFTYEPTFFGRQDGPPPPRPEGAPGRRGGFGGLSPDDPVYQAKKEFVEKHGLAVFRLRDQWLARKESAMTEGLAEVLGWKEHRVRPDDVLYEIPETTAEKVVAMIREKMNLRGGLRAVGGPAAPVRRVLLFPGTMDTATMWKRYTEADMTITGEVREWENTHYAADIFTVGQKRNLVTLGRVASEDPGMRACAQWLPTVVAEVPARWIPAGDLYWRAV